MHNLNPSLAGMRANNSNLFDNEGCCHNHIFLYLVPYSHHMTFQSRLGAKVYETDSPLCAFVTAGGSSGNYSC